MILMSKLLTKIANLDLDRRYFKGTLVKGFDYYKEKRVRYVYSPKYEELIAFVEGTETYAVHFFLKNNNLAYNCTCPYQYDCKHIIACFYYLKEHIAEFDEITSKQEPFRLQMPKNFTVYYDSLIRLIGENYTVSFFTEGDFHFLFNKLCEDLDKLKKLKLSPNDKSYVKLLEKFENNNKEIQTVVERLKALK